MKPLLIYGTRTCSDCIRAKYWLREHNIAYEERLLEENDSYIEEVLLLTNGDTRIPVIVFPDGSSLIEPTNEELSKKIALA